MSFVVDDDDDDPFATTPDRTPFSADDIRQDIARNWAHPEGLQPDIDNNDNISVSTLDMNASTPIKSSRSVSPIREDSFLSIELSSISLSENDHDLNHNSVDHGESDTPYPSIIIDASETSTTHTVTLTDHLTQHSPLTSDHSRVPSTPSLPSESIPSPTRAINEASTSAIPPLNISTNAHKSSPPSEQPLPPNKSIAHRPTRSTGPSAFEKVRSKTRPNFLPPKSKAEDEKHLADWQNMMKLSRAAAEKGRKARQERRAVREKRIEASIQIWEKEIVPDWRVVFKKSNLRSVWWKGIPTKIRAPMWEKAVGNPLALSKDHFHTCLSRAKRALANNIFPQQTLDLLERDIRTTLPPLHLFNPETGPMYIELKDMMYAWVVARSDEGLGYTFGAAKIAGMMLITMPAPQAFNVMRNLLERHCMRSFFGGERAKDDVEAYYRIFDTLLADGMPKIYFNFKQHQISPAAYLSDWLISLFLDHLPFEACARIWDVIMLEGDSFLYRAALGILAVLEPRLFFPDRMELLELLLGENKAAIDVAKREGQALDGGKYEIYGVDEETLWERIDAMEDWWKESTWIRLIQRELPDL